MADALLAAGSESPRAAPGQPPPSPVGVLRVCFNENRRWHSSGIPTRRPTRQNRRGSGRRLAPLRVGPSGRSRGLGETVGRGRDSRGEHASPGAHGARRDHPRAEHPTGRLFPARVLVTTLPDGVIVEEDSGPVSRLRCSGLRRASWQEGVAGKQPGSPDRRGGAGASDAV